MQMISNLYSRDGFPLPQVQSLRLSLLTLPSPFPSPSNPRYLYRTPPPLYSSNFGIYLRVLRPPAFWLVPRCVLRVALKTCVWG
jgi:hypothetical protein